MESMQRKRRVILVTDGDQIAQEAIEKAAKNIGGRCISASAGNPTPITGEKLVHLIQAAKNDPVVIMFDDKGSNHKGKGEKVLEYVANHPEIEVMGILAVASNTEAINGAEVDCSITKEQKIIQGQVDKEGTPISQKKIVMGDTVDVIDELNSRHFVVGIGDIGKMEGRDEPVDGAQVTTQALRIIVQHWKNQDGLTSESAGGITE